ncbi:MAG TPA: sigma-70 family RNA polymerase sigma factor [Candidatus Edwardsbacteria bacterium]|nr:sigma-70 family RNA polymerase sigma factor [Candidatus Edwardsbacteria bacterium]
MPSDERSLVAAARQGDHWAFERLVKANQARIYSLALRMLGNRQDAEDVLQETFIAFYRSLSRFQGRSAVSTYLYRLAVNFCLMKLRYRKSHGGTQQPMDLAAEVAATGPSPLEQAERSEQRRQLDRALQLLPAAERAVVVLRDVQGLSGAAVARVLKLSLPAMKSRLHRGREALRRTVAERGAQQGGEKG